MASRPRFAAAQCRCIATALVALALVACSQGDGETCQQDRDCDDGLVCLRARNSERSVCRPLDEADAATGGAAGEPSLPADDAGREDAGRDDAGPADAGGEPDEQDAGDEPADLDAG